VDAGGWWSIFNRFELINTWFDTLFCYPKTQVAHFFAPKDAFLQVHLDVVLDEPLSTLFSMTRCSSWLAECTNRSSMYTMTLEMPFTIVSINLQKLAGQPNKPMRLVTHCN
jgi:hypothetical protein